MRIVCLGGDGIGPEVMAQGRRALAAILPEAEIEDRPFGLDPLQEVGTPLPEETLVAAMSADAVLLGAVGALDYSWTDGQNPEDALFRLRQELDVFANLRPVSSGAVDLMIVRELVGGIYFGERGVRPDGTVFDTLGYHPEEIRRVSRKAFEIARQRDARLTSVDKANVLATSRLWRRIVGEVATDFPEVAVEHLLVDTAALYLARDPAPFDVILTENMFGDILSDVAAAHGGGLGLLPSASLGATGPGLFEPAHGSAPDLAGRGIANPSAMLLSIALMLRWSLGRADLASTLEAAVSAAIERAPTPDLGGVATTEAFGDLVVELVSADFSEPAAPEPSKQWSVK